MGRPKKVAAPNALNVEVAKAGRLMPSGVTLLDLACSDSLDVFCTAGHGVNFIGDRDAGKTAVALASQGETFHRFGDEFGYDLYDAENAFNFDVAGLWGAGFAKALNVITVPENRAYAIEPLGLKIIDSLKSGKPRFIVIDSMDRLRPVKEYDGIADMADGKSGFNTARAKANRLFFNTILPRIAETRSFLIYLSQATCNMGYGAMFQPKVRGGGTSLGFNAHIELWFSQGPAIKVGNVKVGHWVFAKTARSKVNGKKRDVTFPILPAYGVDDTRANIEWLAEEGVIGKVAEKKDGGDGGGKYDTAEEDGKKKAPKVYDLNPIGIEYVGKKPYLFVEQNGFTQKVVEAVAAKWAENERGYIEKALDGRKGRYE